MKIVGIVCYQIMIWDVFGKALRAYELEEKDTLILHNNYGESEEMPVWYFFREYEDLPELEKIALFHCRGKILDIGAGAGAHTLILQEQGQDVRAIDVSPGAVDLMKRAGVRDAAELDFFHATGKYDTLFCLMNGIGIIGKLENLQSFLTRAKKLLNPGGQLLVDSSDITYLYEGKIPEDYYFGEVRFQYEFREEKGEWFDWVYIDPDTLLQRCKSLGWNAEILHEDDQDQFLVRLTPE